MGALTVFFLFISVKNIASANEPVPLTKRQAPDLVTSSVKYSAQEYHHPSHALYTVIPKAVPVNPSQVIYAESPTKMSEFVAKARDIVPPEYLKSPTIPALQEEIVGSKTTSNQCLKEPGDHKTTHRQCKRLEGYSPPSIAKNIPQHINVPSKQYLPTRPNVIPTQQEAILATPYIHQNQITNTDPHNIPQKPEHQDVYENRRYSNVPNAMYGTPYNRLNLAEEVISPSYILPYSPSFAPAQAQTTSPYSILSMKHQEDNPSIVNFVPPKEHCVDTVQYIPRPKVTKGSKNISKADLKMLHDINEFLSNYGIITQSSPDESKTIYNPASILENKINNFQPLDQFPSVNSIPPVHSICQKDLQSSKLTEQQTQIKNVEQNLLTPKPSLYITDSVSNIIAIESNSPQHLNVNSITVDEGVIKNHLQSSPHKPVIKKQTDNENDEVKSNFDISKRRNDNADIKNQIDKIKQKINNLSIPVQANKNINFDTEITQKQYSPNKILSKSEPLETSKAGLKSRMVSKNSNDKLMNEKKIQSNLNSMQNLESLYDRGTNVMDNKERVTTFKVNKPTHKVDKDFNHNVAPPLYNDVHTNNVHKCVPIISLEDLNCTIHNQNEIAVNEKSVSNAVNFCNSGLPIVYEVNTLNKEINDILQSTNIKEIINNAVRKSLSQIEIRDKVVPVIATDCINHVNSEVNDKPNGSALETSHIDNQRIKQNTRTNYHSRIFSNQLGNDIRDHAQTSFLPYKISNSLFEISPAPVTPVVIKAPYSNTITISDKIIKDQPQIYTKVSSQYCPNPENVGILKPDFNPIPKISNVQNSPEVYQPRYTSIDSLYPSNAPTLETVTAINELNSLNPHAKSIISNQVYERPKTQCAVFPNDKYTSLISSSLNNIASVIVTNLLSSINTNIVSNINSSKKSISSIQTPISDESTTSLSHASPSIELPFFEVTPTCVESPSYLPEPSTVKKTGSDFNVTSLKNGKTEHNQKISKKEPCVSTITINVLPSVQQTSNDIIILV